MKPGRRTNTRSVRRSSKFQQLEDNCGSSSSTAFTKFMILWLIIVMLDTTIESRAELLWPFLVYAKNCYDAWKYHGCVFGLTFLAASLFSDFVMLLVIPIRWLPIAATAVLFVQFLRSTGCISAPFSSTQLIVIVTLFSIPLLFSNINLPRLSMNGITVMRVLLLHCVAYPLLILTLAIGRFLRHWIYPVADNLALVLEQVLRLPILVTQFIRHLSPPALLRPRNAGRKSKNIPRSPPVNSSDDAREIRGLPQYDLDDSSKQKEVPFRDASVQCMIISQPAKTSKCKTKSINGQTFEHLNRSELINELRKIRDDLHRRNSVDGNQRALIQKLEEELRLSNADNREKDELQGRISSYMGKVNHLEAKLRLKHIEIVSLQPMIGELRGSLAKYSAEIESLKKQNSNFEAERLRLVAENSNLIDELNDRNEEVSELVNKHDKERSYMLANFSETTCKLERLQESVHSYDLLIVNMRAELSSVNGKLRTVTEDRDHTTHLMGEMFTQRESLAKRCRELQRMNLNLANTFQTVVSVGERVDFLATMLENPNISLQTMVEITQSLQSRPVHQVSEDDDDMEVWQTTPRIVLEPAAGVFSTPTNRLTIDETFTAHCTTSTRVTQEFHHHIHHHYYPRPNTAGIGRGRATAETNSTGRISAASEEIATTIQGRVGTEAATTTRQTFIDMPPGLNLSPNPHIGQVRIEEVDNIFNPTTTSSISSEHSNIGNCLHSTLGYPWG